MDKKGIAIDGFFERILILRGDGNCAGVSKLVDEKEVVKEQLNQDLHRITDATIPIEITFRQGQKHTWPVDNG